MDDLPVVVKFILQSVADNEAFEVNSYFLLWPTNLVLIATLYLWRHHDVIVNFRNLILKVTAIKYFISKAQFDSTKHWVAFCNYTGREKNLKRCTYSTRQI
jgi:hypothetical protein